MLLSRLTVSVSKECPTNRSLVWYNCEQNRSHCEHTFAVKSRKLSRTFVSIPQRLAKATLVPKRQPREARLYSAKASADAATADSLTTPEYATPEALQSIPVVAVQGLQQTTSSTESVLPPAALQKSERHLLQYSHRSSVALLTTSMYGA